jgi:serine/threonine protein kinase
MRLEDYHNEHRLYTLSTIKPTLPPLFAASDNADGSARASNGYLFPPYLAMERGVTLAEWLKDPRSSLQVLSMFNDCAMLLAAVHAANFAHRDLKPENVLIMLQTQAWRLIDFGIASPVGTIYPLFIGLPDATFWFADAFLC